MSDKSKSGSRKRSSDRYDSSDNNEKHAEITSPRYLLPNTDLEIILMVQRSERRRTNLPIHHRPTCSSSPIRRTSSKMTT